MICYNKSNLKTKAHLEKKIKIIILKILNFGLEVIWD